MAAKLSAALHIHFTNPPLSSSFSDTKPYKAPFNSRRRLSISCHSTKSPHKFAEELRNQRNGPSLSEQLRPLSGTVLADHPKENEIQSKPLSIWVNPTRPRPSALSLHRHSRSAHSSFNSSQLRELKMLAGKMNESDLSGEGFAAVLEGIPETPGKESALILLKSLRNWEKSLLFLEWIKSKNLFPLETIFYNVAMKSLRSGGQFRHMEELAVEMVENGVDLDNITYSTIITGAKRCNLFDKAIEWFERMYRTGLIPDEVTYSAVLDVYAQSGMAEEAMGLYERGRASGWAPDAVAVSVLAKAFASTSDYNGIVFVIQEIKELEIKPTVAVYNALLQGLGKARKPGHARSLFREMVENGIAPDAKTLTFLIKIYGKARWGRDVLELWEMIKSKGWPMDTFLCNTLLNTCAELGLVKEAERLFGNMKASPSPDGHCVLDNRSYTAMLNVYASVGDPDKAMSLFEEMREGRVGLDVMGCTCLVRCLGNSRRINDLVAIFEVAMERGIKPDDRLSGSLLSVLSHCDDDEDALRRQQNWGLVSCCLQKANPSLAAFMKRLLQEDNTSDDYLRAEFQVILRNSTVESQKAFCNALIDICRKRNLGNRARTLLRAGTGYGVYPHLQSKAGNKWCLDLRTMSAGAAQTAFEEWMTTIARMAKHGEPLPEVFTATAGAGGLARAFAVEVERFEAPFKKSDENGAGVFVAKREDLVSWIHSECFFT
ncbi:unnamed protein product [Cuscuta campestris]|uniref:Smr domain-containing protein n=1 Tax=Cuscuta campestris TaxID=132261 RepID=A0A484KKE1_9ASTE|nr:unnamed protein product [Cuscuta campestris]